MAIYWRNGWAWARKTHKGVEYREPLGTRSKREADSAYQRWCAALTETTSASKGSTSYKVAVNNFTENHFQTLKPASRVRYLQSLLTLNPYFEGKTLQQIGKADLSKFVADRRKSSARKGGVKSATIIRDLQCLSSVFTVAADFDLCESNPVAQFLKTHRRRKTLANSSPRKRYLSHVEEQLILDYAVALAMDESQIRRHEKAMVACAFALYLDLGFRAQELLHAGRSWFNLRRNEVTVPKEFSKSGEARTVPLLPRARRIVELLPINKHSDYLLWRTASGKPFADLNKTLQRYADEVGVKDLHIHDLRRTCGCRLLQDHKTRMEEVSKWLGHASVEQTEDTYAFLEVDNLHDAIGGRVIEKAARLHLSEMYQMQFDDLSGTRDGTRKIKRKEAQMVARQFRINS